jgi:hypothetical protein
MSIFEDMIGVQENYIDLRVHFLLSGVVNSLSFFPQSTCLLNTVCSMGINKTKFVCLILRFDTPLDYALDCIHLRVRK